MKKRWEPIQIDLYFNDGLDGKSKSRLEKIGEILYSYYCQLDKDSISGQTSVAVSSNNKRRA